MMDESRQANHNMCSCSVTTYGRPAVRQHSNGARRIPTSTCPHQTLPVSFDEQEPPRKSCGRIQSPGETSCTANGRAPRSKSSRCLKSCSVGGDAILYSFPTPGRRRRRATGIAVGNSTATPKTSKWVLGGEGHRNNFESPPRRL